MLVYSKQKSLGWIDEDKVGAIDKRPCLTTTYRGGRYYAEMMNPDGSVEQVFYDDSEYGKEARIAKPIIDATNEDYLKAIEYSFENWFKGHTGIVAKRGMIVKVTKGRVLPIGTEFEVEDFSAYEVPGTYGHKVVRYVHGTVAGNKVRCNIDNVVLIGINMQAVKIEDWYF